MSAYEPLDLFSGDPARQAKAVHNLLQTPQNNFKIFVDSKPLKREGWEHAVAEALSCPSKDVVKLLSKLLVRALQQSGRSRPLPDFC